MRLSFRSILNLWAEFTSAGGQTSRFIWRWTLLFFSPLHLDNTSCWSIRWEPLAVGRRLGVLSFVAKPPAEQAIDWPTRFWIILLLVSGYT